MRGFPFLGREYKGRLVEGVRSVEERREEILFICCEYSNDMNVCIVSIIREMRSIRGKDRRGCEVVLDSLVRRERSFEADSPSSPEEETPKGITVVLFLVSY
jgi:hypothetical protein